MRKNVAALAAAALGIALPFGAAAAEDAGPSSVERLSFSATPDSVLVYIKTSVPVPRFICTLPSLATPDPVVELPDATAQLQSRYPLDSPLLREVAVESRTEGGAGVRLRFTLGSGRLSGVEQVATGLLFRFQRPGPAASPEEAAAGPLAAELPPAAPAPEGLADSQPPVEYRIEVGDKLEISVFDHDDLNKTVEVREDGTINLPLIGDVPVKGRTVAEIDAEVTRALGADYLVDPQVAVALRESQNQFITIIGEVRNPGRYILRRNMRLIDLLAEAGGASKEAGTQIVVTRRQQEGPPQQIALDRDRLLRRDNTTENIPLRAGDIVTVGEKEVFYIRGEVRSPSTYLYESGMTILKAVSMAGGFTQFANRKEIQLLRMGAKGITAKTIINLKAIESGKKADVPLLPDDIIIVTKKIF